MISISTQLFDLNGVETFDSSIVKELNSPITRRISSVATLDGGSFFSDNGYSETDNRITFKISDISRVRVENLERIAKLHSKIWLSTQAGTFSSAIDKLTYFRGDLSFSITIIEEA